MRALKAENRKVQLMLSLEIIGHFSDESGSQSYPFSVMQHLYSDKGNFIALVGKMTRFGIMRRVKAAMTGATTLPVYSINAPSFFQGIDFSDHLNYWHEGIRTSWSLTPRSCETDITIRLETFTTNWTTCAWPRSFKQSMP